MAHAASKTKKNLAVPSKAKKSAPPAKKTPAVKAKPIVLRPTIKTKPKKASLVVSAQKTKPKAKNTTSVSTTKTAKLFVQKGKATASAQKIVKPQLKKVKKLAFLESKKTAKTIKASAVKKSKPAVKTVKLIVLKQKATPKSKKIKTVAPIIKSKTGKTVISSAPKKFEIKRTVANVKSKTKLKAAPGVKKPIEAAKPQRVKSKTIASAVKIKSVGNNKAKVPAQIIKPKAKKIEAAAPVEKRKQPKSKVIADVKKRAKLTAPKIEPKAEPEVQQRQIKPKKKKAKAIGAAVFRGKKERYDFAVYPLDAEFEDVPAIYIISKRKIDKRKKAHHALVCIGQTSSLLAELKKHRKGKCVKKYAANSISLLREENEKQRLKIETDLRAAHAIPCFHG